MVIDQTSKPARIPGATRSHGPKPHGWAGPDLSNHALGNLSSGVDLSIASQFRVGMVTAASYFKQDHFTGAQERGLAAP
jgi:hypothetical protein